MNNITQSPLQKNNPKLINLLSISIPLAVALLIGIRTKLNLGNWTKSLPPFIAIINSLTALCLIMGLIFIRLNKIKLHKSSMLIAFGLGSVFLITYILYHISNKSTSFGGGEIERSVYYFFLLSHIVLSIAVVRLVLFSLYFALSNQIEKHKKIVKWAYPIWLYVSISGVIVYLMIRPYYI